MAVEINVVYEGQLHCTAKHGPSGTTLTTDAPKDNMGKGESFSPTDLVATALATCVITTMGIVAQRNNLELAGSRVHVEKHMITEPIRRIGRLPVTITVPKAQATKLSATDRQKLENAAKHCPVHASLHPDMEVSITLRWEA